MNRLPAAPAVDPAFAPVAHPTPCPSWCEDRARPTGHHFGPSLTAHCSPEQAVLNLRPLPIGSRFLLRAELMRTDEGDARGETVLYVQGESDMELSADEVDLHIADMEAWVAKLRVLRRQMG